MTYLRLKEDGSLVVTSADRIYQGDNMAKKITFVVDRNVLGYDPAASFLYLVYIRADGHPDIVYLERSEEMYNDECYQYTLAAPEAVTRYPGDITMWVVMMFDQQDYVSNEEGVVPPAKLSTDPVHIKIWEKPISNSTMIDSQLTAIYQMSKKVFDEDDEQIPVDNGVILF